MKKSLNDIILLSMKFFAADFDGTLYFHKPISKELIEKIEAFRKQGNKFGLNTGRGLFCIEEIEKNIDLDFDFYITDSGSLLADKDKHILHETIFEPELLEEILKHVPQNKLVLSMEGNYYIHPEVRGRWCAHFPKWNGKIDKKVNSFSLECDSPKQAKEIAKELSLKGFPISIHPNRFSIDVTPLGVNKAFQFEHLKEAFGAMDGEIIAAGDADNDLIALEKADQAFTFDYAPKSLQEKATVVKNLEEALDLLEGEV